jgi:WD40 repeat protein
VYDWSTKETWKLPSLHQRRITSIGFSADGKYLASAGTHMNLSKIFLVCIVLKSQAVNCDAGYDDDFTIMVWDWETKTALGNIKAQNRIEVINSCINPSVVCAGSLICATLESNCFQINHLSWNPTANNEFCAVGPKSVGFYSFDGHSISGRSGKFNGTERVNYLCVAYSDRGMFSFHSISSGFDAIT